MPRIPSTDVTSITDYLFISSWPRGDFAKKIGDMNVRLVLSMHWIKPSRTMGQPPLRLLWLPTFDNFLMPMPIPTLQRGVEAALRVISDGYRVLVHCRAGVHRSVAMACCVLIGKGYSADEAMRLVKDQRPVADPYARHIQPRIYLFEEHWRAKM
jgi:Dual specificity phosphatase, catalytic domain